MRKQFVLIAAMLFAVSAVGCSQTAGTNAQSNTEVITANDNQTTTTVDSQTQSTTPDAKHQTNTSYDSATDITLADGKSETITSGGYYSISGTLSNGQIKIDTNEKVYIELAGVNITHSNGPAIQIDNAKEVTMTLKAGTTNTLIDGGTNEINAALFSNDTLILEGEGKLELQGNNEHGIEGDDDIIINGGEISIKALGDGIHANDNVTINGGYINITESYEGIEAKNGNIVINDGVVEVRASDDSINAATGIDINGGHIYVQATQGDGIDSNGTINITGGTTVAVGARQPEAGIDCDRNALAITGGTLIAVGGSNSTPTQSVTTQETIVLGANVEGNILHIEGEDSDILTFKCDQSYSSVVFSSPTLSQGKTYKVFTGGNLVGGQEFGGLYVGSTYTGGSEVSSLTLENIITTQGGTGMGGGKGNRGDKMMGTNQTTRPADVPADVPADRPADVPADKPADVPVDRPADKPVTQAPTTNNTNN